MEMLRSRRDVRVPLNSPRIAERHEARTVADVTAPLDRMDVGSFLNAISIQFNQHDDADETKIDDSKRRVRMMQHSQKQKAKGLACFGFLLLVWTFSGEGATEETPFVSSDNSYLSSSTGSGRDQLLAGTSKSMSNATDVTENLMSNATDVTENLHPGKFGGIRNRFRKRDGKRIPEALRYLSDITTPYNAAEEVPFFWDVPFAGEALAERVFRKCHFLIQACEHGVEQPNFNDEKLEVFEIEDGSFYVNVDTFTSAGIRRAKDLHLAHQRYAEVMISPLLHEFTKNIFDEVYMGRMFAIFRHPVDRAISMYYYLGKSSWDPLYDPAIRKMTLIEYARSSAMENNWVTRFLLNKPGGKLEVDDIRAAKEILRKKVLVGLFTEIEGSMARFSKYFAWVKPGTDEEANSSKCRKAVLEAGDPRHNHPPVEEGGLEWEAIISANRYDLELYEYAKKVYEYQGEKLFDVA